MTGKATSESDDNSGSHVGERRQLAPGKERRRELFKTDQNPLGATIPSWLPFGKTVFRSPN